MSFAADIQRFAVKSEQQVDRTVRDITFALFREVIQRTPVLDGGLKGNWQASVGAPVTGTVTTTDKDGSQTIAAMAAAIGGWGSETFMANNLPYAHRVEFDGWSSVKAPSGMARVSFARIQTIVAKAARENR